MLLPFAGDFDPSAVRSFLDQNDLTEIHRQATHFIEWDDAETDGRMAQTPAMRDEKTKQITGIIFRDGGHAGRNALRSSGTGLHQRFRALTGQPKMGFSSPAFGEWPQARILRQDFFDLVKTQVRAAAESAFDHFVPLFDSDLAARSLGEIRREDRARFPGPKELGGFNRGVEFEVVFATEIQDRIRTGARLLAAEIAQRQDTMCAGRILRSIEMAMSNEPGDAPTSA